MHILFLKNGSILLVKSLTGIHALVSVLMLWYNFSFETTKNMNERIVLVKRHFNLLKLSKFYII